MLSHLLNWWMLYGRSIPTWHTFWNNSWCICSPLVVALRDMLSREYWTFIVLEFIQYFIKAWASSVQASVIAHYLLQAILQIREQQALDITFIKNVSKYTPKLDNEYCFSCMNMWILPPIHSLLSDKHATRYVRHKLCT